MSVLQMQRVSICALKKDRKAILEKLQSMGIMEMNQIDDDEDGFAEMDTLKPDRALRKRRSCGSGAGRSGTLTLRRSIRCCPALEGKKLVDQREVCRRRQRTRRKVIGKSKRTCCDGQGDRREQGRTF